MYGSRDRTGQASLYNPPSGRCSRVCRSPSPTCRHVCKHSHLYPTPFLPVKSVRFQDECTRSYMRSKSVGRTGILSPCRDGSPTLPRDFLGEHNLSALLRKLSILQLEMKGMLHGRSLKERVQSLEQKADDDTPINPVHELWTPEIISVRDANRSSKERSPAAESFRWKAPQSKTMNCCSPRELKIHEQESVQKKKVEHTGHQNSDDQWKERKQIAQLWKDYNCDLHLRRIIDSARRRASCRILEKVVHIRLTCYMLQYIAAVAKGLMGDEKTHYLRFFKREGPFRNKPLNEGTYGELLLFVDKQAKPAKDAVKALQVAEEGLEEEGAREGFCPSGIGDIRSQMRVFLDFIAASSTASSPNPGSDPINLNAQDDEDTDLFTLGFLQDLINAADAGKLGNLQKAHKLVKLACFLALKHLDSPRQD